MKRHERNFFSQQVLDGVAVRNKIKMIFFQMQGFPRCRIRKTILLLSARGRDHDKNVLRKQTDLMKVQPLICNMVECHIAAAIQIPQSYPVYQNHKIIYECQFSAFLFPFLCNIIYENSFFKQEDFL